MIDFIGNLLTVSRLKLKRASAFTMIYTLAHMNFKNLYFREEFQIDNRGSNASSTAYRLPPSDQGISTIKRPKESGFLGVTGLSLRWLIL